MVVFLENNPMIRRKYMKKSLSECIHRVNINDSPYNPRGIPFSLKGAEEPF
jgi:hypothetical protein